MTRRDGCACRHDLRHRRPARPNGIEGGLDSARLLGKMALDACGVALIEVEVAADEFALLAPSAFSVRWLHRDAIHRRPRIEPGRRSLDALTGLEWSDEPDAFVWVGCEITAAKALRRHLRIGRALARARHLVAEYWQAGQET